MNTHFDCELSRLGFNLIKDLVQEGNFLNLDCLPRVQMSRNKKVKLNNFWEGLPVSSRNIILEHKNQVVMPFPQSCVKIGDSYRFLKDIKSNEIYKLFVTTKFRMPVGIHKWINLYNLTDEQVKNSSTFAHACTLSTKSKVFQYKILTFTLPTQEYLWNYQVNSNFYCHRCLNSANNYSLERDNIQHNLFSCSILAPFLTKVFDFFVYECKATNSISEVEYLLGFTGKSYEGLNSALLELKRYIFYHFSDSKSINLHLHIFKNRLRRIILCDKRYYASKNNYEYFYEKWECFSPVYQLFGPDPMY